MATACIVLAMIEDKSTILRDLTLESPIQSLRDLSYDLWCERPLELANGRSMTALEMQFDILERAELFATTHELPADQALALPLWRETLETYQSNPLELSDRIDWISKLQLIERSASRKDVALDSPQLELLDLLYHDTNPKRGLYFQLLNKGLMRRMVSDDQILRATTDAPSTTRAQMRGAFIKKAKSNKRDFTVDWVHLKLNDEMQRTVLLKDPFKSTDERFEKLLTAIERKPALD
jgi:proteasome accessory factor A